MNNNKPPFVQDCPHCEFMGPRCFFCGGTGKIVRDWYYGMRGKIFTLRETVVGQQWHGHYADPEFTPVTMEAGSKVKVVMCSRFGDVGITPDLTVDHGYIARVDPEMLEEVK